MARARVTKSGMVTLTLTRQEAVVLSAVSRDVGGWGPSRAAYNGIGDAVLDALRIQPYYDALWPAAKAGCIYLFDDKKRAEEALGIDFDPKNWRDSLRVVTSDEKAMTPEQAQRAYLGRRARAVELP